MQKFTVTLPQKAFRAVAPAMAVKDVRNYLNGMMIEHNGEETRLAASDGHRLHIVRIEHNHGLTTEPIQVILPRALVDTICKAKTGKGYSDITISIADGKVSASLPDGSSIVSALIDGKFPDYARVIPDTFSGEVGQYNPEYVMDAYKGAGFWLEAKNWQNCAEFIPSKLSSGGISVPGFVAIVMPSRITAEHFGIDTSFKTPMSKPEVIAQVAA